MCVARFYWIVNCLKNENRYGDEERARCYRLYLQMRLLERERTEAGERCEDKTVQSVYMNALDIVRASDRWSLHGEGPE